MFKKLKEDKQLQYFSILTTFVALIPVVFIVYYSFYKLEVDFSKGWKDFTYTKAELGGGEDNIDRAKYYLLDNYKIIKSRLFNSTFVENGKDILEGDITDYYGKVVDFQGNVTNIIKYDYSQKYKFDRIFENRLEYINIILIDNTIVHALVIQKLYKPLLSSSDPILELGSLVKIRGFIVGKTRFSSGEEGIDFVGLVY